MKVTVTFGQTGVVVPCKEGWTVRDLIQQATQRYRKLLEQEGDFLVRTHHVEYCDGGILDPDDILSDLVEDKDKLMAVYEEQEAQQRGVANTSLAPSPDLYQSELSVFQPITGGEIEVNSSALKSNTPLLVRSSSDSALGPQPTETEPSLNEDTAVMAASPAVARPAGVDLTQIKHTFAGSLTRTVEIVGEDSPLGIHVVPYCSSLSGRALGLYIRGVEEESRSRKEGLFQEDECIVMINNTDLMDKTFSQAQEVFRQAMRSPLVRLEVVPSSNRERYEKSLIGQLFGNVAGPDSSPRVAKSKEPPPPVKAKPVFKPSENPATRLAEDAVSVEAAASTPKGRSESPLLKKSPGLSSLVANKRGGRRLRIDLKKGSEGLGFTVVTRDSSVHGPGPILVKNILPRGAAVKDGRLQSGDRILEVNGVDITGVGQEELVCMLRSTRQGESVCLVVLRQEDMFLPREMKDEVPRGPVFVSENGKEQLMFEVPLNDSGSAGLGISLKGNKSRETGEDLGIFIKSIIHGGAAYKDGRLRVNDQLVAVNGESLVGCSNHVAMETLRRSMSQEGNVRGMIQLVVLRILKDQHGVSPNRSFDGSSGLSGMGSPVNGQTGLVGQTNGPMHPPMVNNNLYAFNVTNGSYSHMDEEEDGELYGHEADFSSSTQHSYLQERETSHTSNPAQPQSPTQSQSQNQRQFQHVKASKSMDLGTTQNQQHTVADESNVGSLAGTTAAPSTPVELGPTLGLKKSSSLESLQTAMSEVNRKNEFLPFHRPRQNMVRGRGCNESFRAAIDKSYDGPAEDDDDDGSELSSGRDTPASNSSRQGAGDRSEEKGKKDKKKKAKTKKKEKNKGKAKEKEKEKEKKKTEEPEETEKKSKKIGFGLLRFGKKKEEKKEAKAALQRQKSEILSDHELERMKDERERIEAGHPELRDVRQQVGSGGGGQAYPDVEDDDADPNYARIQSFRDRNMPSMPQSPPYSTIQHAHARTPSPQGPSAFPGHANNPTATPDDDPLDRLYAKVNKPRGAGTISPPVPAPPNDSIDRIQQLRREYQQARREGIVPPYEELDPRRRGHENDTHRMQGRGTDHRMAPRYEEVERQYASLPRRGPMDPADYPMQPWSGHYPGPPQPPQGYPQSPSYPNPNPQSGPSYSGYPPGQPYARPGDPRGVDPGYYPHPSSQQRGPLRQDVPPSPTPPLRGLRYDTMTRGAGGGAYRHHVDPGPEQYGYPGEGGRQQQQHQTNPRQKNPMTAAV
ncbi:partitioning defective 3 homolog B isoform X1 [Sparus aurata]|uniref:partitioning defective 3 homolog B isoform X1 n=2 Tax=Sparus aurata TaxID=8175 RepID=UPI0011C10E5F|nr:partitioning defective 3 homolog B-like isoform X1 [Sparus aurata]XP_030284432.1 partitioning defective 3 homolog B-like isoform X1 [Sparus aurata]XP_030284433.1 partitioning defective 3 homolog B-like isoform X1 [Sparus aurata]XP_030284434.1 partitioning defective 3 homolog B-like isoform X1 [Sparus aurata]